MFSQYQEIGESPDTTNERETDEEPVEDDLAEQERGEAAEQESEVSQPSDIQDTRVLLTVGRLYWQDLMDR